MDDESTVNPNQKKPMFHDILQRAGLVAMDTNSKPEATQYISKKADTIAEGKKKKKSGRKDKSSLANSKRSELDTMTSVAEDSIVNGNMEGDKKD